ncbi:MAG TPA: hypothetical protein DEH22_08310 [Chloroflexi bacterium]|nr:hypothetical protein [Chloroflexota bacterium]
MSTQPNQFYSTLLLVAALISAIITTIAWKRREQAASARSMAIFGAAMVWWCLMYAIHWLDIYHPSEFFWLDLTYVGAVVVPAAFLAFALDYADHSQILTRPVVALLSIEPLLTLFFLFTDARFGIFFAGKRQPETSVIQNGGFGFWFNIVYSYSIILIGFVLIFRTCLNASSIQRSQTRLILLGAAFPWVADILLILGLFPLPNLDPTPMAFVITSVTFSYAIFSYGFLDIVPIARSTLVENMPDGVLVLDKLNRLADINPRAKQLFEIKEPAPIGQPAEKIFGHLSELLSRYLQIPEGRDEIMITGDSPKFFDVRISALADKRGNFTGRLVSVSDITLRKEIEIELRNANQQLQLQISEIEALQAQLKEQAIRDPLTGLYNRRYLQEFLEHELSRATRESLPLSLVMMDIDRFKKCNDTYGHKAGDMVLQGLAEMLLETTRKEDLVCRYGGEEFVVVLPGSKPEITYQRTEIWRQNFQDQCISIENAEIHTTLSAGIACFPVDGDSMDLLLMAADNALYRAKQAGRNQVFCNDGSHSGRLP